MRGASTSYWHLGSILSLWKKQRTYAQSSIEEAKGPHKPSGGLSEIHHIGQPFSRLSKLPFPRWTFQDSANIFSTSIMDYFSDREIGSPARTLEVIDGRFWGGIVALVRSRIADGSFGVTFPDECPDGRGVIGSDAASLGLTLAAEIPQIPWPLDPQSTPATLAVLDLVEFCFRNIAKSAPRDYHSFFQHEHLKFDRSAGQFEFRNDINRLFARNALAYELEEDGQIRRLSPPVLREALANTLLSTGDALLDSTLESARARFLDPSPSTRREALNFLWDAWERLKTISPGADKKASVAVLLSAACTESNFRARLDAEARELTNIGNAFHIRHSEVSQIPISDDAHVDYLFHRMFALIWLLLSKLPTRS
jgi:hypothetical protein